MMENLASLSHKRLNNDYHLIYSYLCRVGWGDNNSGDRDNNFYELNLIYSYVCRVGWGDNNSGDSDNNCYELNLIHILVPVQGGLGRQQQWGQRQQLL